MGTTSARRRPVLIAALVVAIVVAVGLGCWQLVVKNRPAPAPVADDAHAREQVTDIATTNAAKMLTFGPRTDRQDVDEVARLLTSDAADEYRKTMRSKMSLAASDGVSQSVQVRNAAVESLTDHDARVLAFVDQSSRSGADNRSTKDALAFRISLAKVDGDWLISELEQL